MSPLLLVCIGLWMLALSWLKWADILVDFGRELYIPWQLNSGSILYLDIAYFNGPLSPYFNSLLFKLFGTHLMTIAIFNIFLIIVITWLIYRFFLMTTDRLVATLAGATFLSMFAFSQYTGIGNYNFVCPYSHELTHGFFLSLFSIYLFAIYLDRRKDWLLGIIGLLIGMAFLTKVEVFFAISTAIICGIIFVIVTGRLSIRKILKILSIFFIGFLLPIIAFIMYLYRFMSLDTILRSVTLPYKILFGASPVLKAFYQHISGLGIAPTTNIIRYLHTMGLDEPARNITALFLVALSYLGLVSIIALMAYIVKLSSGKKLVKILLFILFGTLLLPVLFTDMRFKVFRGLPLAMLFLGGYFFLSLLRFRDNHKKTKRLVPLLVMTVFAFLLLLKMFLRVGVPHYGFTLALPGTLLLVMVFLYQIPISLGKIFQSRSFIRSLGLVLASMILISYVGVTKKLYEARTFMVGSGGDTIFTLDYRLSKRGPYTYRALQEIDKIIEKDDSFIVFPEGVMLNYLSRRINPTPYINFMSAELIAFGKERILNSFIEAEPDYIIFVNKNMGERGYHPSGKDYCPDIVGWIKKNYSPVSIIGNEAFSDKGFGITINKRISNIP